MIVLYRNKDKERSIHVAIVDTSEGLVAYFCEYGREMTDEELYDYFASDLRDGISDYALDNVEDEFEAGTTFAESLKKGYWKQIASRGE